MNLFPRHAQHLESAQHGVDQRRWSAHEAVATANVGNAGPERGNAEKIGVVVANRGTRDDVQRYGARARREVAQLILEDRVARERNAIQQDDVAGLAGHRLDHGAQRRNADSARDEQDFALGADGWR